MHIYIYGGRQAKKKKHIKKEKKSSALMLLVLVVGERFSVCTHERYCAQFTCSLCFRYIYSNVLFVLRTATTAATEFSMLSSLYARFHQ